MGSRTEQKTRSHEAILESAARLLRERGIGGARVADVMKGAELTVGGFYAHFGSKDELVDRALERACARLRTGLFSGLEGKAATERIQTILERYLSKSHRDSPQRGCPFPAIVSEAGSTEPQHRPVVGAQVQELVDGVAAHLPGRARTVALGLVALMVGGLSLARAVRGSALSDEVLRACRDLGLALARRSIGEVPGSNTEPSGVQT